MGGRGTTREPVARLDQRPVEAAPVVAHEPGVRRDPAGDLREEGGLVRVVGEEQLGLAEHRRPPSERAPRGTRASPPPSRAPSSPCRGTRSGASGGGCPGRRARRSRSSGMSIGATTRRTSQPSGVSATSAPSAAARRAASCGLRRPANGARAGRGSEPAAPPRASVARRFASRRSRVTAPVSSAVMPPPPSPAPARLGREPRKEAERERLPVHVRLEPRTGACRAAGLARAGPDEIRCPRDQLVMACPQPLRQADAPGHRLVQVDRRRLAVGGPDLRHEAEVPRVEHQQDRGDGLDRPPRADERDVELVPPPADRGALGREPVRGRLELDLREVDGSPAHVLVGDELELLVQRHEARDHHLAVDAGPAGGRRGREHVERLERDRAVRVGVVVHVHLVHVRLPLAPVELVHVVLDGVVHVDRVLVDEHLGAEQVHLAEDPGPVRRRVDDHHVLGRRGPQRDLRRREVLRAPVPPPVVCLADGPGLAEEREQVVRRSRPEPLAGLERQLERRRAEVREQDVEVVRVQARLLRLARRGRTPGGG